jgi:hypothetical protein
MDRSVLDLNDMTWSNPATTTTRSSKGSEETKKSKAGLTEEEKDEMFMSFSRDKMQSGSENQLQKSFSLMSLSKLKLHEKVNSMAFDDVTNLLYSSGSDKVI